ncbi:MAG TPA: tripartite tricarboxylate transporter substrate-binding protein, partial [Burkholderiales bacterium]|nr:tripartite tricarboxylate transporter substrate-binding protein [Burkholderiales bacterium]
PLALGVPAAVYAQITADAYPARAIRLVASLAPGSSGDRLARTFADQLGVQIRQKVLVENRPGDGGNIPAMSIVKAAPDGYSLLFSSTASLAIQMVYNADTVGYSLSRDLSPVSTIAAIPNGLFVTTAIEPDTLPALVRELKAKPGQYSCASSGVGGLLHLTCELFKKAAGVNVLHVAYKGSTFFLPDLVSGRIAMAFDNVPVYVPMVNAGKLKVLAVTSAKRVSVLPYVPTAHEIGMPRLESMGLFGLLAPLRTPDVAVNVVSRAAVGALRDPALREMLMREGVEPGGSSPDGLRKQIGDEIGKWAGVIKEADIQRE